MHDWEPPCGCLESNPGLLWEQSLLNVKSSLQARKWIFLRKNMLLNLMKHYFIIYLNRTGRSLQVRTGEQGHSSLVAIRRQLWASIFPTTLFYAGALCWSCCTVYAEPPGSWVRDSPVFLHTFNCRNSGITDTCYHVRFDLDFGDMSLSSYMCETSSLPSEPPPRYILLFA